MLSRNLAFKRGLCLSRRLYNCRFFSDLPLSGVKVVDLTRVLAGPYCTQILGDLGAEVIKVEHPTRGDDTRAWGPPFAERLDGEKSQESAYYLCVNRNKESIGLNFKDKEGQNILKRIISQADVVVENYIPGNLAKYGLDYDSLKKINPGLIYASITGYGQTGPYKDRPGYDVMVEAEFGLMHITGDPNGHPVKVGVAVTDLTTGLYAANSIMASLIQRGKTGRGQYLDVCLSDCQTATLANIASSALISGKPDAGRQGTAHPSICPYQSFDTAQGGSVMIGGGNDKLFRLVCDALGKPEWKEDPRFIDNTSRVKNRDILVPAINEITKTQPTAYWLEVFERYQFPFAAVNDIQSVLKHEHTKARNMVTEIEHPDCGPIKLVNTPVKYSETQPSIRTAPPTLGQNTIEIMTKFGYTENEVEQFKKSGIVG
ncbi:hypothetical protein TRICI_006071 [Trichomonascus ciferrii]|uniref:CoA-transferase family III n=1 Tax=Trichomonascus ciferrii TaxID=44093 RepID=A0A642ULY9_9ASCO|nr:hypothetical protein TRICI_006071 [Trichomonascus ciferrii]